MTSPDELELPSETEGDERSDTVQPTTDFYLHEETLQLLEWPALLNELLQRCLSPMGQACWTDKPFLAADQPLTSRQASIQTHLREADSLRQCIQRFSLPVFDYPFSDLHPIVALSQKQGQLSLSQLAELLQSLLSAQSLIQHIRKHWKQASPDYAHDKDHLAWLCDTPKGLIHRLNTCITPQGQVLDDASPAVFQARQALRAHRESLDEAAKSLTQNASIRPMLRDANLTERNGRAVLVVLSTYKSKIKGVIHGESASGQTLFVEPDRLIPLNNKLQRAHQQVNEAIQALLKTLSAELTELAEELEAFVDSLARLDRLVAAGQLALELDATIPTLRAPEAAPSFTWTKARHPLLLLQAGRDTVVPNSIQLGHTEEERSHRTLLITGPNTGGKTVLLKLLGLFTLMLWAGLPLPVGDNSQASILSSVFADLGDAQNLQQNLSTFSGHLSRLSAFVEVDKPLERSLVLIDEIAAGTDPVEGTALARAYLRHLYQRGALSVVTTHLGALKLEAREQSGYLNASVAFDAETLQPTYHLLVGVPGASHALSVAERYQLPRAVIDEAETLMGQTQRQEADYLVELEQARVKAQQATQETEALKREWESKTQQLRQELADQQANKKRILSEYRAGLKARLREMEQQAKRLKKQLNQTATEAQSAEQLVSPGRVRYQQSQLRHLQRETEGAIDEQLEVLDQQTEQLIEVPKVEKLEVGQVVRCAQLRGTATIEALSRSKVTLRSNDGLKAVVSIKDVQPAQVSDASTAKAIKQAEKRRLLKQVQQQAQHQNEAQQKKQTASAQKTPGLSDTLYECDVRGLRVQAALEEVDVFLDAAVLSGLEVIGVIHGLGTGVLKKAVREHLSEQHAVKTHYPAEARFGGDGKTIIELT